MVKVNAVIMAGHGKDSRPLIDGVDKVFLEYNGKTLVEHVAEALRCSENVLDFRIVGPRNMLEKKLHERYGIVDEVGTFVENALVGYNSMEPNGKYTLFIFGDIPYVRSEAIDYVLRQIPLDGKVDVYLPVCMREKCLRKDLIYGPYMVLEDGNYRTANMAIVDVKKASSAAYLFDNGFKLRRLSEWNLGTFVTLFEIFREVGFRDAFNIGLRYFSRRLFNTRTGLRLIDIKDTLQRKFALNFDFIVTPYVDTVVDIDTCKQYSSLIGK